MNLNSVKDKILSMQLEISFTYDDLEETGNKIICHLEDDQLYLSNIVDLKHIGFFKDILPEFSEIVYFEHDRPICPRCGSEMADNGSREVKPNKLEGIRKKNSIFVRIVRKVR